MNLCMLCNCGNIRAPIWIKICSLQYLKYLEATSNTGTSITQCYQLSPPFSDYWLSASEDKFVSLSITYVGKDFGYFSWNLGCQKVPFADDSAAAEECRVLTLEMLDRAIASLHLPDSCEKIRDEAQTF